MWSRWTEKARAAIWAAHDLAEVQRQSEVAPEQLLFALLRDDENVACRLLKALPIDPNTLRARILHALPEPEDQPFVRDENPGGSLLKPVVDAAYAAAWELNTNYIGTEHLLLGLLRHPAPIRELLESEGVTSDRIRQTWRDFRQQARTI